MSSDTPPAPPARNAARPAPPAALITGRSSGIGHATALRLHAAGFAVYATARQPESLGGVAAAAITTLRLDVTDEASTTAVVRHGDGGPRQRETDRFPLGRSRVILGP